MYRPQRQWAWDEKAKEKYAAKRARLAEKGYVSDEDVCRYFAEQGVPGYEPQDVRAIMLDAITAPPLNQLIRALDAASARPLDLA
ncbi:hypothetical protein SSTU70S_05592 [Stutzerimonas stutzeri]